jgi:hypothetical protein
MRDIYGKGKGFCMTKYHNMKANRGNGGKVACTLDLDTTWK